MNWQYKVLKLDLEDEDPEDIELELNTLAQQGWEVIFTDRKGHNILFLLKMPAPAPATDQTSTLAYFIWQQLGKPKGEDTNIWLLAESILSFEREDNVTLAS